MNAMQSGPPAEIPQTARIAQRYAELQSAQRMCLDKTMESHQALFGDLNQLDSDMDLWVELLPGDHLEQFTIARRELALAGHCASSGLYRQAFSSLRLFLELSFAAVYFSVHEFERRRWEADKIDFSWSRGLDVESGVLSKEFVDMFNKDLSGHSNLFASEAASVYRHCSQFIHGKALTSAGLPDGVFYVQEVVGEWGVHAKRAGEAVLFLLLVRYGEEMLKSADLVEAMGARFGHLSGVRGLIGLADA